MENIINRLNKENYSWKLVLKCQHLKYMFMNKDNIYQIKMLKNAIKMLQQ